MHHFVLIHQFYFTHDTNKSNEFEVELVLLWPEIIEIGQHC